MVNKEGALLSMAGEKLVIRMTGFEGSVPSFAKDKNGELWVVRGRLAWNAEKGPTGAVGAQGTTDTSDVQRACASRDGGLWLMVARG